ncbi:uncharacterized protein KRP23_1716 [Phytophthora ramorum]|uniref:uncharacterized protein n=1 Tax=Phytophthora ramorum TaxID=164328 RepID=UPI00309F1050|nr:hypothetical protein KRP23_1716 [Phytophthora ramorum]
MICMGSSLMFLDRYHDIKCHDDLVGDEEEEGTSVVLDALLVQVQLQVDQTNDHGEEKVLDERNADCKAVPKEPQGVTLSKHADLTQQMQARTLKLRAASFLQ